MDNKLPVNLINIKTYAEKYQLHRNTVFDLMKNSLVTVYIVDGKRLLNPDELPPRETLLKSVRLLKNQSETTD